jgi:two-component system, OmpR family, phosphate regulon sensor histidine kinase PhoR
MTPGFNLTVQISVLVLLVILLAAILTIVIRMLIQSNRRVKLMAQQIEELRSRVESAKPQKFETPSIQEAYLQFIYNLSHEVSNPLQSVQTNLENMAECSPEEVGRWKQYYVIIRQEMKRLSTLTENLRLLSQLESVSSPVKREPVNLRSVIEDVIMAQAERAEARNIRLHYEGPNRPAKILGNRGLLHEVILNLVDNSIKYSKDSGGEIVIGLREDHDSMHVTVKDDGPGIPAADLPFIFDTAYRSSNQLTVHRKGSGLGLAIVKRIVDQHDGQIRAESVPGAETTILIDLPLYKPNEQL